MKKNMSKDKYVLTHFFESNNFDFNKRMKELYPKKSV